ncbi:lipopolysaccharide heptosyltransferase II [Mucilaginibacter lappiensis]|uniref:Lipopolysaccharide heptosyltransferase II n=1 Tax=Mucilaginibacter lappiensis TaxID=354630 RepID=A0ABR6PMC1_9SPHI|nr:glycosyltransferase family 9 protein [Mucilaginibacter lappiensis]MBB6110751.1 lipopolysaccharide heptosyltransferase II [Mucilaginibacter lappiensis]SIR47285.1 lipopolysaccharide heptosyltransferase II [Mucilaginibacter lappiensis]
MKILIRLPNWLGDVVMSTAFVNAVGQLYPDAQIDVIIKKELSNIAPLIPGITQIHPFSKQDFSGLSGVYRFGKKLKAEKYDLFFNLPQSLSSLVMGWATRAKKRVGFGKEGGFFLLTNSLKKPVNLHRVDEYVSLLEQFTGKTIAHKQVKLNASVTEPKQNNRVLVNFNSEASSRRMPLDKGRGLLNKLTAAFPDITFGLIGSPKEVDFVSQLITGSENPERLENYAGKTHLPDLCSLMAQSAAMLTTDSGPAHLANSVGTPVIVLFGAGNEYNTAPYNKQNLIVLRYGKLTCEPCVRNTCKLYGVPRCMELLDELQIINTLSQYTNYA